MPPPPPPPPPPQHLVCSRTRAGPMLGPTTPFYLALGLIECTSLVMSCMKTQKEHACLPIFSCAPDPMGPAHTASVFFTKTRFINKIRNGCGSIVSRAGKHYSHRSQSTADELQSSLYFANSTYAELEFIISNITKAFPTRHLDLELKS